LQPWRSRTCKIILNVTQQFIYYKCFSGCCVFLHHTITPTDLLLESRIYCIRWLLPYTWFLNRSMQFCNIRLNSYTLANVVPVVTLTKLNFYLGDLRRHDWYRLIRVLGPTGIFSCVVYYLAADFRAYIASRGNVKQLVGLSMLYFVWTVVW